VPAPPCSRKPAAGIKGERGTRTPGAMTRGASLLCNKAVHDAVRGGVHYAVMGGVMGVAVMGGVHYAVMGGVMGVAVRGGRAAVSV
jgi:hypothetical protein